MDAPIRAVDRFDVVLLWRRDCPNVATARTNLERAIAKTGIAAHWREIDLDADDTPPEWKRYGSPTILVDGADVAGGGAAGGATCRVYDDGGVLGRAPSVDLIAARLVR